MIHNRPYIGSKCVVIIENKSDYDIFWNLGKWLEQISPAYKIVVKSKFSSYLYNRLRVLCERYKKVLGEDIILSENIDIVSDIKIVCSSCVIPTPYAIDVVQNIIQKDILYKLSADCFVSTSIQNESLEELQFKDSILIGNVLANREHWITAKCCVFIPCMNRLESIKSSLPQWIEQTYKNKQIVLIDYSSENPIEDEVRDICNNYQVSFSTKAGDADVVLFRIDNQKYFNISHAYNYAISRMKSDVICTVCADSCPRDYYLELVMNLVDQKSLVQCWWGLHSITYDNWKKLNGHQEFVVGWGGEDDDFRMRAKLLGLEIKIVPSLYIYEISQDETKKGLYREVKDIHLSSQINTTRFEHYLAEHGYVGNYGKEVGKGDVIKYIPTYGNSIRIFYAKYCNDKVEPEENEFIQYYAELNMYYVFLSEETSYLGDPLWWTKFGELQKNGFLTILDINDVRSALEKYS